MTKNKRRLKKPPFLVDVKCFAVMKKFISPMRLVRIQTLINALPKNSPQDCFYLRFFANARNLARSPSSPATSTVLCKKIKTGHIFIVTCMVEVTGLEPAASWSQTKHSTKLSYTSKCCLITTAWLLYTIFSDLST